MNYDEAKAKVFETLVPQRGQLFMVALVGNPWHTFEARRVDRGVLWVRCHRDSHDFPWLLSAFWHMLQRNTVVLKT